MLPAFRTEDVRVGAVDVSASVHGIRVVGYNGAGRNEEGGFSVWAAAEGKDSVFGGGARVSWDYGVDAEG
jgi:hypothetical protein